MSESYTFRVITKEVKRWDFNYSRDFDYETIKTDDGYTFRFYNKDDYENAKDLTMYVSDWKDESKYIWVYDESLLQKQNEDRQKLKEWTILKDIKSKSGFNKQRIFICKKYNIKIKGVSKMEQKEVMSILTKKLLF